MSSFRYRAENGVIDIAANVLTAQTGTLVTMTFGTLTGTQLNVTNALVTTITSTTITNSGNVTVGGQLACDDFQARNATFTGFEAVSTAGMHLQYNKAADGKSYILNEKGSGTGGLIIGSVTTGNVVTPALNIVTDVATANINTPLGRFDVTGTAASGAFFVVPAFSIVNTAVSSQAVINCAATGFASLFFQAGGVTQGSLAYSQTDGSVTLTSPAALKMISGGSFETDGNGPMLYKGQDDGTVARLGTSYLGGPVGTEAALVAGNTFVYRTEAVATFNAGSKLSLTIPSMGHFLIIYYVQVLNATAATAYSFNLNINGVTSSGFFQTLGIGNAANVGSGTQVVRMNTANQVVNITTTGAGTSGADSVFQLTAVRIG
jgi:hypothetical protein